MYISYPIVANLVLALATRFAVAAAIPIEIDETTVGGCDTDAKEFKFCPGMKSLCPDYY